jgi:hypothetical protein
METPQIDDILILAGQMGAAIVAVAAALGIIHRIFFRKLTDKLERIDKELHPNGGSSLRDVVNRIEKNQGEMKDDIHDVREKVDDHIIWHLDN